MVIDAGQTWSHKHTGQPVDVLGASDGLVVFTRKDQKLEWPLSRFLVWYRCKCETEPKPKPESQSHPRRPMRDQLWYSHTKGESCLIKDANPHVVSYQYATSVSVDFSDAKAFVKSHDFYRESPSNYPITVIPVVPHYDPADVAFNRGEIKQALDRRASAGQAIRRASKSIARSREMRDCVGAILGAVRQPAGDSDMHTIRLSVMDALVECERELEALRGVLGELESRA
jgi:hypothetical protein